MTSDILKCKCPMCVSRFETLRNYRNDKITCPNCKHRFILSNTFTVEELEKNQKEYLKELLELIEIRYGKIIDKCDFISLSGGGSTIFKSTDDGFIRVPKSNHEYYNAIGFWLWGISRVK